MKPVRPAEPANVVRGLARDAWWGGRGAVSVEVVTLTQVGSCESAHPWDIPLESPVDR